MISIGVKCWEMRVIHPQYIRRLGNPAMFNLCCISFIWWRNTRMAGFRA